MIHDIASSTQSRSERGARRGARASAPGCSLLLPSVLPNGSGECNAAVGLHSPRAIKPRANVSDTCKSAVVVVQRPRPGQQKTSVALISMAGHVAVVVTGAWTDRVDVVVPVVLSAPSFNLGVGGGDPG